MVVIGQCKVRASSTIICDLTHANGHLFVIAASLLFKELISRSINSTYTMVIVLLCAKTADDASLRGITWAIISVPAKKIRPISNYLKQSEYEFNKFKYLYQDCVFKGKIDLSSSKIINVQSRSLDDAISMEIIEKVQ